MEQRAPGTLRIWAEPFTTLRVPKIFNLRTDPYERADITSNTYYDWLLDHAFLLVPAQDYVGKFLMTFKDYPQRQKAASFNLDEVMAKLREATPSLQASLEPEASGHRFWIQRPGTSCGPAVLRCRVASGFLELYLADVSSRPSCGRIDSR